MQIKKIFEINCQCCVYRNNIKLQVKGEKGLLRKVVITLHQRFPDQQAPPVKLGIKLKQPTLESMFSRQKQQQKEEAKEAKEKKPEEMEIYVKVYCQGDELFSFNVDECINLTKSEPRQSTLNLQFADKILSLYECPTENLKQFLSSLIELHNQKQMLKNRNKKNDKDIQTFVSQTLQIQENQVEKEKKELNEIQKLKLQRRQLASQQQQLIQEQIPKQINKQRPNHQQEVQVKQNNQKFNLPPLIWGEILKFIENKYLYKLRLLNKQFELAVNQLITNISFNKFIEVPLEVINRCIIKFPNLLKLELGQLRNIKPQQLQELKIPQTSNLIDFDISYYNQISDKLLSKFILNYQYMKHLSIPYSKITSETINLIYQKLKNLEVFRLIERERGQLNEDINFTSYLNIFKLRNLKYFRIPVIQIEFFQKFQEKNEQCKFENSLIKIKIGSIIFQGASDDHANWFFYFFSQNKNITKISLGELYLKNNPTQLKSIKIINDDLIQIFNGIFDFSFSGNYDNEFFQRLCQNNTEIKHLKIRSKSINDDGLRNILLKCQRLELIDVQQCSMISGQGFEYLIDKSLTLEFPKIIVKVSLDEFNLKCVEELLQRKSYEYKLINLKLKKNY